MPEGWQTVPIGDVLVSAQYGLSIPVTPDGTVPIVGMKDMIAGRVENSGWGRVELPARDHARYLLQEGDILLNRTNSPDLVGKVALWTRSEEAVFPSYIVRFRTNKETADAAFINYVLNSDDGQTRLKALSTRGVSQANINPTTFRKAFTLHLPPAAEQRRIATVLDAWDEAIATVEKLIAAKRERFAWMREAVLTGCVRLSGFGADWRHVLLSQVLHEHGATSTGAEPVYPVSVHRGLVDQVEHLGRSFAAASTSHYNRVKPGDIVYTKSPTGDFPLGIIKQSKVDREVIVSPLYGVFKPETRALGIVLDAYFSSATSALRYLTPLVQKGAKNTIAVTNTQFLQGEIRLPVESREVDALAALIGATLENIAVSESEATLLRRQRRGLMQKLLTGEWRVPAIGDALAPGGPTADRLEAAE